MQLVIIAGGKGTRLRHRTGDLPKPMVRVGDKPLLEHQVLLARRYQIKELLFLTGHGADYIERYFGNGDKWGVRIRYQRESEALGTAGAVIDAFDKLDDIFLVLYGDTMLNVDLQRMAAVHPAEGSATLFLHPNDHPQDSDLVELDDSNQIAAFHPYPHANDRYLPNLVSAGLYVCTKRSLLPWLTHRRNPRCPLDFGKHVFPELLACGKKLYGYRSREYIKDAGTPNRLDRVTLDYASGRIGRSSFESPASAIFLDRDGTLNYDHGWVRSPGQMELLPGAAESVFRINQSGRLAVVITNQPVVARGECTHRDLGHIHSRLEWLLAESHAFLDRIYYCPHHPDKGFPGERTDLKFACSCRKPNTGLLERAQNDLNIDPASSWMIGDRPTDILAAKKFGVRSIFIGPNARSSHTDPKCDPDFQFDNLLEATRFLLHYEEQRQ
ncbi:MAG: HAD-IIIA family hydrolase [Acidobacteriaceae bacterium]|nr:HAD-IIIA family hydrolase [Acidobacteriaceae bacterium]